MSIYADRNRGSGCIAATHNPGAPVQQGYIYDPYGAATILNAGMTAVVADGCGWVYTFQGGRYDPVTGKINFRHRDLDTTTGTWMEKDPLGYVDGSNLYDVQRDDPVVGLDPLGTQATTRPSAPSGGVSYHFKCRRSTSLQMPPRLIYPEPSNPSKSDYSS